MEKMTNVKALEFVLANATLPTEVKDKIESIKASYVKKSQYKSDKPTKTQIANDVLKSAIIDYLSADGGKHTISEIIKNVPALAEIDATTQKVSPLVRSLCLGGVLGREEIHRKAYFFIRDTFNVYAEE